MRLDPDPPTRSGPAWMCSSSTVSGPQFEDEDVRARRERLFREALRAAPHPPPPWSKVLQVLDESPRSLAAQWLAAQLMSRYYGPQEVRPVLVLEKPADCDEPLDLLDRTLARDLQDNPGNTAYLAATAQACARLYPQMFVCLYRSLQAVILAEHLHQPFSPLARGLAAVLFLAAEGSIPTALKQQLAQDLTLIQESVHGPLLEHVLQEIFSQRQASRAHTLHAVGQEPDSPPTTIEAAQAAAEELARDYPDLRPGCLRSLGR